MKYLSKLLGGKSEDMDQIRKDDENLIEEITETRMDSEIQEELDKGIEYLFRREAGDPVTYAQLSGLATIDATAVSTHYGGKITSIADLTGLNYADALKTLNLSENTGLISNLTSNLAILQALNNKTIHLEILTLNTVATTNANGNSLFNGLKPLNNIIQLNLMMNSISNLGTISGTDFAALKVLNLGQNIDLTGTNYSANITALQALNDKTDPLEALNLDHTAADATAGNLLVTDLKVFDNVVGLSLENNSIDTISFAGTDFGALTDLNLGKNTGLTGTNYTANIASLKTLSDRTTNKVVNLGLDSIATTVDAGNKLFADMLGFDNLTTLYLNSNNISDLGTITSSNFLALNTLNINSNSIADLSQLNNAGIANISATDQTIVNTDVSYYYDQGVELITLLKNVDGTAPTTITITQHPASDRHASYLNGKITWSTPIVGDVVGFTFANASSTPTFQGTYTATITSSNRVYIPDAGLLATVNYEIEPAAV